MPTLIQNATLVSSAGLRKADILIEGERIAAVGTNLQSTGAHDVLDASGLLAFPGLIDVHTHLREPGGEHKEDFYTGTCAAVAGGVTAVFGMPNTAPAVIDAPSLHHALGLAASKAVCDFGLFLGATNGNAGLKTQTPGLLECGLKIYMGSSTGDLLVEGFAEQYAHFEQYPHDRVIAVHAEHEPAVRFFGTRGVRRPPICAELETGRAIALAEATHRRLHICHVSTRREVELIADAKARGASVTCEYAPHHLFLTTDSAQKSEGAKRMAQDFGACSVNSPASFFQMNPPLREASHASYLWSHLDVADCIGTDHAPHTLAEKQRGRPPMGLPGLEDMLPLLLTAVHAGRLRLEDIARLCCEGPAHAYAIARKGKIEPGFDADITLVDPKDAYSIGERPLFTKCAWTAYAGMRAHGSVHTVYVRGGKAFGQGKVLAAPGSGKRIEQTN